MFQSFIPLIKKSKVFVSGVKVFCRIRLILKIDDGSFHMTNIIFSAGPNKLHFTVATHTPLEITRTDKGILL
jgi:hypothetical protein